MNLPIPDVKEMPPEKFVMWICAILLGYGLYNVPSSTLLEGKLDNLRDAQATMLAEHKDLLAMGRVQCVNWAEMVSEKEMRARHLRRCITLQVNEEPLP